MSPATSRPPRHAAGRRRLWQGAFVLTLAIQLGVLFSPRAITVSSGMPFDKAVHAALFGAVAWTGIRAGLRPVPVVAGLLLYGAASELAQEALLPSRSGDILDVLADTVGTLLGAAGAVVTSPRQPAAPDVRSRSAAKLP